MLFHAVVGNKPQSRKEYPCKAPFRPFVLGTKYRTLMHIEKQIFLSSANSAARKVRTVARKPHHLHLENRLYLIFGQPFLLEKFEAVEHKPEKILGRLVAWTKHPRKLAKILGERQLFKTVAKSEKKDLFGRRLAHPKGILEGEKTKSEKQSSPVEDADFPIIFLAPVAKARIRPALS